jgi:uncharacterized coiled-coil protein SlyX
VLRSQPPAPSVPLARQAREHFLTALQDVMVPLADAVRQRLSELVDTAVGSREGRERRDTLLEFDGMRRAWQDGTAAAWRKAAVPPTATARVRLDMLNLELIGDDVVENKILSSKLAQAISDKASWELNDLKLRMQHLDNNEEQAPDDILRPEAVAQLMLEQWTAAGLQRAVWVLVQDVIEKKVAADLVPAYKSVNTFLVERGVLPDIELATRVRRAAANKARGGGGPVPDIPVDSQPQSDSALVVVVVVVVVAVPVARAGPALALAPAPVARHRALQGVPAARGASGGQSGGPSGGAASAPGRATGQGGPGADAGGGQHTRGLGSGVADETRMMTSSTPLARARMRATGVIGQLKRLLTDKAGYNPEQGAGASPALVEAIGRHAAQVQTQVNTHLQDHASTGHEVVVYDDAAVEQVAVDLRQRTTELKKKASTQTEKATIEIVALMFQSILSEERIPPAVRVWFARLQMPVLRVALAEPEFFGTLQHPARQLIDRMGSCVLGFNAAAINGSTLEIEIKRVVQVIEQYPETGRRVFQLVYDEFQKFLSKFLTEKGDTQRLVSVAQQVEQKETLAIQYTIELRKMLNDIPVREEIREFLFKVWAEVLAVAAVRNGPQHAETIAMKKSAADLVWSASAKPNRAERAKVIQDLPNLLTRLRTGMSLLGLQAAEQEKQIKLIGDTLADAFMSKTESIPQAQIDALTKRLANLEDFVSDDPGSDAELPLDAESIEMMLGIDASMIEVVADGGSKPSDAMLSWALELQQGNWFTLDHTGKVHQVQYVWRSDRRQLHLFASSEGRSFLVQLRRLASYLQAGLLLPAEEEALTVRATRDALAKLDANPERLLA